MSDESRWEDEFPESRRPRRRKGPVEPLTREAILEKALELADREGLKALSMRRLGAELDVDPMALYHYLPSKEALYDALVEAVWEEVPRVFAGFDPEQKVVLAAQAQVDAILAHSELLPLFLVRGGRSRNQLRILEAFLGVLAEAGVPAERLLAAATAVNALVRGHVGMVAAGDVLSSGALASGEGPPPTCDEEFVRLRAALAEAEEPLSRSFEAGIRAVVRGFQADRR
jgi:AcrR family transcriptional regulator